MGYPIEKVSFSSLRSFVTNPGEFKERHILKIRDRKRSPSMIVGTMAHAVLEAHFRGKPIEVSVPEQIAALDAIPNEEIKFGKTGSREKIVKDFHNAVKAYFEEFPKYGKIVGVEEFIEGDIADVVDGSTIASPIPFCGKIDLVHDNGKLIIEDYKFVKSFEDGESENPGYIFQAFFYYYLSKIKFGRYADECVFREIKISQNKDGSSQHNLVRIPFHGEIFETNKVYFWYNLSGFFAKIENTDADSIFTENIFDPVYGSENFERQKRTVFGYKTEEIKGTEFSVIEERSEKVVQYMEDAIASTVEDKIRIRLQDHGIPVKYETTVEGYAFDRFLFTPGRGVKMKDVTSREPEICQALGLKSVRIIAPVPGTTFVGIEIPRENRIYVDFREHKANSGKLPIPLGMEIGGKAHFIDLADSNTPHIFAMGRTGSGKSQFLKTVTESLNGRADLVLIDPKRTELSDFRNFPNARYVTESQDALNLLWSLTQTMDERFMELSKQGKNEVSETDWKRIVVIVEEYADLFFSDEGKDIERHINRLAYLGRAAGIHLVLSTQRPSVDIVSGKIKSNIATRVCFATASQIDSKVALDDIGAENLLGKGDLLYRNPGHPLQRLQGFAYSKLTTPAPTECVTNSTSKTKKSSAPASQA